MNTRALLVSVYYLWFTAALSLFPALLVGVIVLFIAPEWTAIGFGAVFTGVFTEFIFKRKGNWLS